MTYYDYIIKGYRWLKRYFRKMDEDSLSPELCHHGVKGQKWGVRNGPPYPLEKSPKRSNIVLKALASGEVSKKINREKQIRHTKSGHTPGRSYLDGDLEYAQELVDRLSGTGEAIIDGNNRWTNRERVVNDTVLGTHVDKHTGAKTRTNKAVIIYSRTGSHIYPGQN